MQMIPINQAFQQWSSLTTDTTTIVPYTSIIDRSWYSYEEEKKNMLLSVSFTTSTIDQESTTPSLYSTQSLLSSSPPSIIVKNNHNIDTKKNTPIFTMSLSDFYNDQYRYPNFNNTNKNTIDYSVNHPYYYTPSSFSRNNVDSPYFYEKRRSVPYFHNDNSFSPFFFEIPKWSLETIGNVIIILLILNILLSISLLFRS